MPLNNTPPEKLFYKISEVAGIFNINISAVRFWEKEFDILKPKKNNKGNRLFTQKDIKNIQIITSSKKFTDLEEFHILQQYKCIIISNSTFAWWAAYLNNVRKSKIYAPRIWYNQPFPKGLKIRNMTLI